MRRYAKAGRALTAFETDITRYKELQHDIQSEEGVSNIGFIRIDCQPLKQRSRAPRLASQSPPAQPNAARSSRLFTTCRSARGARSGDQPRPARRADQAARGGAGRVRTRRRASSRSRRVPPAEKFESGQEASSCGRGLRGEWASTRRCCTSAGRLNKAKAAETTSCLADGLWNHTRDAQGLPAQRALHAAFSAAAGARRVPGAVAASGPEADMAAGLGIFASIRRRTRRRRRRRRTSTCWRRSGANRGVAEEMDGGSTASSPRWTWRDRGTAGACEAHPELSRSSRGRRRGRC